jgi:hypothetical protein
MQVKIEYLWEMGPTWRLKLEREFSAGTHGKGEGAWALPGVARGHNSSLDRVGLPDNSFYSALGIFISRVSF